MERVSNLPLGSDPYFTGRRAQLEAVGSALRVKGGGTCVVAGPSGVGKTHLATRYAVEHADKYTLAWVLRCDQASTLNAGLAQLAERLGISTGEGPTASLRNDIRRYLAAEEDWLLIFDNAGSPTVVMDLLPRERRGHVIVTATQGNWAGVAPVVDVGPMAREESVEFLGRRSGRAHDDEADRLAMALGDLPIALELAGALVAQQGGSYRFYLRQFEQLWAELLDTDHRSAAHPSAVAMAWELSYRHLRSVEPVAADLLALCSYLSTDEVRLSLLHGGSSYAKYPLAPVMADPIRLGQVAGVLATYSLAEFDERSLRLHGATASLARTRLPDEEQQVWARVAMRVATGAFTYRPDEASSRRGAAEVLPHVLAAASHADHLGLDPSAVARALTDAGQFFYECGQFARARDTYERAMGAARQAYGEGHPKIAALSDRLARAMVQAGQFEKAREHFERAIEMDAAKYGYNDPHVATLVNNYGRYHFARRDYATARQQYEWARNVLEGHYGSEHQRVAAVINNIGYVHGTEGDLGKAREHLEKALEIADRTYPQGHPDVARIAGNLGRVAQAQGERNVARALLEKALVIDRAALGYEHPDTVRDYVYLGDLLMQARDFGAAGEHYRQAMNSAEAAFGLYHAAVVCCLEKLAAALGAGGDDDAARWARDRAAAIRRSTAYEAPVAMAG